MRNCCYKNAIYCIHKFLYLDNISINNKLILNYNPNYDIITDEFNRNYNIKGPYDGYDRKNDKKYKYYSVEQIIEDPVKKKTLFL